MSGPIPLRNVQRDILKKVLDYCKYHMENRKTSDNKPPMSKDEIKACWKNVAKKL